MNGADYDVAIAGGGLAGLSVARQLTLEYPNLRVLVAEKRQHPVAEAAFKVGESSVEIGAHFFQTVLGLNEHLRADQLEKLGLRYFFTHADNRDIRRRVEFGPAQFPPVPSFQLDRGRFENFLLRLNRDSGIEVLDGAAVRDVQLGRDLHSLTVSTAAGQRRVTTRWLIDASGRAGLLRRQLGLTRPVRHSANACWFRIQARLRVDDWCSDADWSSMVPTGERWMSTNHLMGRGYWVWLIPLGSGSTSVGIVADEPLHPFTRINRMDRALEWLRAYEPQCAEVVEQHKDQIQDFLALKHYAFGCSQVFSQDRWMLIGEAGVFTDPFYSPGSDFIAMGSEFITDVIGRDMGGEAIGDRVERYNSLYLKLFESFLRLYDGQYALMGNAQVMTAKAAWDNGCYWGITALLYFQRRFRQPAFLASIEPLMRRFTVLHARMQTCFTAWDVADAAVYSDRYASVLDVEFLRVLQRSLGDGPMDDEALRQRLEDNLALLHRFALTLQSMAAVHGPDLGRFVTAHGGEQPVDLDPICLTPLTSAAAQAVRTL
ncbi:MAG: NAD(P)/FAD-dependent oxidoreductase [Vicinamibacteria bacterium]|nr:NAD(P)/FAD-dependent oxidoreductase [Vicinamibacteria bacterium]